MSPSARRPPDAGRWRRVSSLFDEVVELDAAERERRLEALAADDAGVAADLVELLAADERAPGFLDGDAVGFAGPAWDEDAAAEASSAADERLGPYRILGELGRGGMSRVLLAERDDERLVRRVAIKRLHAPAGRRADVERRFLAEGRLLAALDHPHIARIYDAGIDDRGDPYLVMELVEGDTLTGYCRGARPSLERRLELFLEVCSAVAHAHRHFVVHRDLKPSNVLVDAKGRAKLLDFGIAKLLADAPGEPADAAPTRTGLLPMTPEYAAPEQVRGEEITTGTDVYALGLLLYELLAGERPYRLESRRPAELERVIATVEPQPPSVAVAREPTREAAALRPPLPAPRLAERLRGDLDTIVLKALRKEPAERYATVDALAEDLRRYLDGRPIAARPASAGYRLRKFAGRHPGGVAAGGAALLALALFGVQADLQRRETARERDRAQLESERAREVTDFLLGLFRASDPNVALGEETTARELLERGAERAREGDVPERLRGRLLDVLADVYGQLGSDSRAEELLREALASTGDSVERAGLEARLAAVRTRQGDYEGAIALYRSALAVRRTDLGERDPAVATTLNDLGVALKESGDAAGAEAAFVESLELRGADRRDEAADTLLNLGELLHERGRYAEAEPWLREARSRFVARFGPLHLRVADADNALANLLARQGRHAEAEPLLREALGMRERLLGEAHPLVARSLNDLAVLLEGRGDFEAAAPVYEKALAAYESAFGADHLAVAITAANSAGVDLLRGRPEAAERLYERSLAIARRALGPENRYVPRPLAGLGVARLERGDLAGAEPPLRRAVAIARRVRDPGHPAVAETLFELGRLELLSGRAGAAAGTLEQAHAILTDRLGPRHARTVRATIWWRLAVVAVEGADHDDPELDRATALQRELLPPGHPHLAEAGRARALLASAGRGVRVAG